MEQRTEWPVARTERLVVKAVGDELLIYDLARHRAHSLSPAAAAVWRACDGTQDAGGIAARLQRAGAPPVTEPIVRYTLAALGRAEPLTGPVGNAGVTRRDLLRRLGTAAAVTLPIVTSIVAPTTVQAQSCVPNCQSGGFLTPIGNCQTACETSGAELGMLCSFQVEPATPPNESCTCFVRADNPNECTG